MFIHPCHSIHHLSGFHLSSQKALRGKTIYNIPRAEISSYTERSTENRRGEKKGLCRWEGEFIQCIPLLPFDYYTHPIPFDSPVWRTRDPVPSKEEGKENEDNQEKWHPLTARFILIPRQRQWATHLYKIRRRRDPSHPIRPLVRFDTFPLWFIEWDG